MTMKVAVCVLVLWSLAASEPIRYDSHKVVRVTPRTKGHIEYLKTIQQQYGGHDQVDFWTYPRGVGFPVDISLSPAVFDRLYRSFSVHGLQPKVTISDVQLLMDQQRHVPKNQLLGLEADLDYGQYHNLAEIVEWMKTMAEDYPDLVTEINVGKSYEGRDITGLKISSGGNKPGFWMEGGIHAREWITPATVIYMTAQMLEKYNSDPNIKSMVDLFEWYIVPVINVDGYEYSWIVDRLWRKTRSVDNGTGCFGADPNRNWDDHWCEGGASDNPCSDTYCGPSAFSEVEVKDVSDYMKNDVTDLQVFLDVHSYSQLWMTPWGYTTDLPPDYDDQMAAANESVAALKERYGTEYLAGSIANIIYIASGGSADWVYDELKVKYSYGVELRDKGEFGFLLPEDQIIPSGEETLDALEKLATFVANNP